MGNLNKVMLIGNLTRDPEVRYTPKGTAVSDIALAINRYFSVDGGERQEETTFVDVTLWGKQAELASQFLSKGRSVYIEGRLQMDTWEDKQSGQKRSKIKIVCENMQFLDSRGAGGGSGGGSGASHHDDDDSGRPAVRSQGATRPAPSRPAPARPANNDDFGDGPITDGAEEGDEIPF